MPPVGTYVSARTNPNARVKVRIKTMAIQLPVLGRHDGRQHPASPPRLLRTLKVGELARLSGKTVRALHLYEERGLLEPIERSKGGYRLYAEDALVRVRWISKLQE